MLSLNRLAARVRHDDVDAPQRALSQTSRAALAMPAAQECVPALQMIDVVKRFGETLATDSLNLSVRRGETIALLGPSGCGKTTLLRMLAGFEQPSSGTIRIDGVDVAGKPPYERSVGILFQQYALFPHMSVADNIGYGLKRRGWRRAQRRARIDEMLTLVRLDGMGERWPAQLSGGQQQRVALARALATGPALILLDEPLSALDAQLRHTLRLDLKRILRDVGATAILVTHDQEEAMVFAERIVVLRSGRIEQQGTSRELYMTPRTRFVAEFVGKSNWIGQVHYLGTDAQRDTVMMRSQAGTLLLLARPGFVIDQDSVYDICIRPEHLTRLAAADTDAQWNRIEATVLEVLDVGPDRHVVARTPEGDFTLWERTPDHGAPRVGDHVQIGVRPEHCFLVPAG